MGLPFVAAAAGALWVAGKLWESWDASSRATYGLMREVRCARYLLRVGAIEAEVSPGSRGPYDLRVTWPGRRIWLVQLKSSRSETPRLPGPEERRRLKAAATRAGAVPIIGLCKKDRTAYYHAVTDERVYPGA